MNTCALRGYKAEGAVMSLTGFLITKYEPFQQQAFIQIEQQDKYTELNK